MICGIRLHQRSLLFGNIWSYEFSPVPTILYPVRSFGIDLRAVRSSLCAYEYFLRTIIIPYDLLAYDRYLLRHLSLTNIRRHKIFPYDLYPIRYFGILSLSVRSFSFTNIGHYEHYTVQALSHTIFSLSVYELFLTNLCHANIIHTILFPDTIFVAGGT